MRSLIDHVADMYARAKYDREMEYRRRYGYNWNNGRVARNVTVPDDELHKAHRAARTERLAILPHLEAVKPETLNYLHDSLHHKTHTLCLPDDDYWMPDCVIAELSSMEDVMAAAKAAKQNTVKAEIRYVPDEKIGEVWAKAQMGLAEGFLPVDELKQIDMPGFVSQRRAPNHPRNLETIYNFYQKIDGAPEERTAQLKVRSMSTGDAIVIDGVAYYVANKGFVTKAEDGTITPVEEPAEA